MISTRHAQANSPSFPDTYDASLPNQNLIYLVGNVSSFLQQDEISALKLQELTDDAVDGYIFEVNLHYTTRLHNRHDDYPLAAELLIDRDVYSSTQPAVFPESAPQRKLTPNLRDKVKYVVHNRNLKLYLQLGLVVTKVHRVLTFKELSWLKTYIDLNTRQCSLAGLLQIDEQQCIWEDAREFEEPCKCRADNRRSYFTQTGC